MQDNSDGQKYTEKEKKKKGKLDHFRETVRNTRDTIFHLPSRQSSHKTEPEKTISITSKEWKRILEDLDMKELIYTQHENINDIQAEYLRECKKISLLDENYYFLSECYYLFELSEKDSLDTPTIKQLIKQLHEKYIAVNSEQSMTFKHEIRTDLTSSYHNQQDERFLESLKLAVAEVELDIRRGVTPMETDLLRTYFHQKFYPEHYPPEVSGTVNTFG